MSANKTSSYVNQSIVQPKQASKRVVIDSIHTITFPKDSIYQQSPRYVSKQQINQFKYKQDKYSIKYQELISKLTDDIGSQKYLQEIHSQIKNIKLQNNRISEQLYIQKNIISKSNSRKYKKNMQQQQDFEFQIEKQEEEFQINQKQNLQNQRQKYQIHLYSYQYDIHMHYYFQNNTIQLCRIYKINYIKSTQNQNKEIDLLQKIQISKK